MAFPINIRQFIIVTELQRWVGVDYFYQLKEKSLRYLHTLNKLMKQSAAFRLAIFCPAFCFLFISLHFLPLLFYVTACKRHLTESSPYPPGSEGFFTP